MPSNSSELTFSFGHCQSHVYVQCAEYKSFAALLFFSWMVLLLLSSVEREPGVGRPGGEGGLSAPLRPGGPSLPAAAARRLAAPLPHGP